MPLAMDTSMMDSALDFGINAPKRDRVQLRKLTTCLPIHSRGLTTTVSVTSDDQTVYGQTGDTIVQYNFGKAVSNGLNDINSTSSDTTFSYNEHAAIDSIGYQVQ